MSSESTPNNENDLDIIVLEESEPAQILMFFNKDLRRIVSIHAVMFEKLLEEGRELPLELAELFEDVANTYLYISERISARHNKAAARD
jgi:hypothetical protein